MKHLKRNVDGITLIALVITIIVLLILAGISIAMLTGENGILRKARQASETTKDVSEDEQVKLAVADALINGTGTLSKDNLEKALKSEFGEDATLTGDGPWTFKGERKTYTIETTGNITSGDTTTPPTEEKLAKNVLKIDLNAEDDYKKSPYVKYNGILCRVFYNDKSHGLQIITDKNVAEKVNLGINDNLVASSEFELSLDWCNVGDDFKRAAASYNRSIYTLNEKAKNYMSVQDRSSDGARKIAMDARSLGSVASLDGNGMFLGDPTSTTDFRSKHNKFSGLDDKFKVGDTSYVEDADNETGRFQSLDLSCSEECWLASRMIADEKDECVFCLRALQTKGRTRSYTLCSVVNSSVVMGNNGAKASPQAHSLRPVFLISPDVKVKSGGDGTESNPYELEL